MADRYRSAHIDSSGPLLVRLRRPWSLAVATIVVFAATWVLTSRSFFFADDFLLADYFAHNPAVIENLTRSWFGHLMPAYIASDMVFVQTFGMSWDAAAILMAGIHAGAFVAFVRCLDAAVGRRWINLLAGLAFAFSVAQVQPAMWWAATLNNVTALALCVSTLGCLTRWIATDRWRFLVATVLTFGLAVAFSEKSLLFAVYAALWCLLVLWRDLTLQDRLRAFARRWPVWLGMGVIVLVVGGVFLAGPYIAESGPAASASTSAAFIAWGLTGGLVPSLFGMDLWLFDTRWYSWIAIAATNLIMILIVAATVRRRPKAWGPWVFMATCALIGQAVLSRRADIIGLDNARLLRYQLDNTAMVWLGGAVIATMMLLPQKDSVGGPSSRYWAGRAWLVAVLVAASLSLWVQSVTVAVQSSPGAQSRKWIDQVERTWPVSTPPFMRFPLPASFTLAAMYPYNMSDHVLPLLYPDVSFTDQLSGAWVIGGDGTAGAAAFEADTSVDLARCLAPDESAAVPVDAAPGAFIRVDYDADDQGTLVIDGLGETAVRPGAGTAIIYASAGIPDATLTITAKETPVCVGSVSVGQVAPAPGS